MAYLTLQIDDPALNIEKMSTNKIMLLVGKNGTGKTFLMITNYCLANALLSVVTNKAGAAEKRMAIEFVQELFNKSFDEVDWTGKMEYYTDDTTYISVDFERGVILDMRWSITDPQSVVPAKFLSKSTRQFDFMLHYLRSRRALSKDQMLDEDSIRMLLTQYKMYDLTFIESLIVQETIECDDPQQFKNFDFKVLPKAMHIDRDACTIQIEMEDGTFKNGTRFSAGEQALLIMFFGIKDAACTPDRN